MSKHRQARVVQLVFLLLFLGIWELACRIGGVDPQVLPPFTTIVATLVGLISSGPFLGHVWITATRVIVAFAIGTPLAILAGFYVGERAAVNRKILNASS